MATGEPTNLAQGHPPYRGGVAIEELTLDAPGPSARFPRLSAVVPIDALDLVGDVVSHWLYYVLPEAELQEIGARHVRSRYDLRLGRQVAWCPRCGRRVEAPVPPITNARFCPRLTPDEAGLYARVVLAFLREHAACQPRHGVGSILAAVATLVQRSSP